MTARIGHPWPDLRSPHDAHAGEGRARDVAEDGDQAVARVRRPGRSERERARAARGGARLARARRPWRRRRGDCGLGATRNKAAYRARSGVPREPAHGLRPAAPDLPRRVAAPDRRTLGRRRRDARSVARGPRPRATANQAPGQQRLHGDLRTGGRDRHAGPHDGAALRRPDRSRSSARACAAATRPRTPTCSGGSPATAPSCRSSGPTRRPPQRASSDATPRCRDSRWARSSSRHLTPAAPARRRDSRSSTGVRCSCSSRCSRSPGRGCSPTGPARYVVREPEEITATIERLNSPGALVP